MSFFSSTTSSYKPQVRVEGFHLPSPGTPPGSSTANGANGDNGGLDLFPQSFLPDAFRKFPQHGASGDNSHDFNDDLVSLIGDRGQGQPQSAHGGPNGGGAPNGSGAAPNGGGYDEGYHRTHNIFDVSSPIPVNSNPNGHANGPGSQPSSLHSPSTSLHDYHNHPPPHFNSTLPALNSSMRYEPPPENNPMTPSSPQQPSNMGPSSYHGHHNGFQRHTPSPIHSQPGSVPVNVNGRSRSRSRPPSQGQPASASNALNAGGVGPARTTRPRRGSSISGTSPPPLHGRPHAILIPGGGNGQRGSVVGGGPMSAGANPPNGNPWFMGQGANQNSGEYLPTPESVGSHPSSIHAAMASHHHSHSHSQSQSGYGPFSLSSPPSGPSGPEMSHHLPPLHHMAQAQSLPKSPMDQPHLSHQPHHLSGGLPKSPMEQHSYPSSYGFGNGSANGSNGSPPGASPGSLPSGLGVGMNGPMPPAGSGYAIPGMGGMNMGMAGLPGSAPVGSQPAPPPHAPNPLPPVIQAANGAPADKQALLANEKRRRRRESHNAVERRRRDNINEKISELATLIPECMLDGSEGPPNAKDNGTSVTPPLTEDALVPKQQQQPPPLNTQEGALKQEKDDDGTIPVGNSPDGTTVVKANKGMILRKSVEYIRYLQQLVTVQGARNRELEQELRKFRGSSSTTSSDSPPSSHGTSYDSLFGTHGGMTLTFGDDDDREDDFNGGLDIDDAMSLGGLVDGDGGMVLHDEFVGENGQQQQGVNPGTSPVVQHAVPAVAAMKGRKGHHRRQSSSSKPKAPRLPSMPEEEMEVDKLNGIHDDRSQNESQQDQLERGRTSLRGVRSVKEDVDEDSGMLDDHHQHRHGHENGVNGSAEGEANGMYGLMNGHAHHHQQQHVHQQQQMGW